MSRKKKDLRFSTELSNELQVEQLNFSLHNRESYSAVTDYFEDSLEKEGKLGTGILAYTGRWTEDRTVFVGENVKLETYILSFVSDKSMKTLETFREKFMNSSANESRIHSWKVSKVEAFYLQSCQNNFDSEEKLSLAFENTLQMQQKSVPKVAIEKKVLLIGGKTGASHLQIQGLAGDDLKLKKILSSIKLKSDDIPSLMVKNSQATFKTIVAFFAVSQLSSLNQSECIQAIRTSLVKNYDVGSVYAFAQSKSKANTTSGKYIMRSLSGIRNKLLTKDTSVEAQELLLTWLGNLCKKDASKIHNVDAFFESLSQAVETVYTKAAKPARASQKSAKEAGAEDQQTSS